MKIKIDKQKRIIRGLKSTPSGSVHKVVKEQKNFAGVAATGAMAVEKVPINKNLKKAFEELSEGDAKPFFFVSTMKLGEEHPTAYKEIMTIDWAQSFVDALDKTPFPLSARGHANMVNGWLRAENDGYVFGGYVDEQKEELHLLNYLHSGHTEEAKGLYQKTMKEMKAGMLSTSISNYQKTLIMYDDEKNEYKSYVVESIAGQRNDIVEHDLKGSDTEITASSYKSKNNKQEQTMATKEMIEKLCTLKKNGDLDVSIIADSLGLECVTEEHRVSLAEYKAVKELLGNSPIIETINNLKAQAEKVSKVEFESNRDKAIGEVFKNESLKDIAKDFFSIKEGDFTACKAEVERIQSLKSVQAVSTALLKNMSDVKVLQKNHYNGETTLDNSDDSVEM